MKKNVSQWVLTTFNDISDRVEHNTNIVANTEDEKIFEAGLERIHGAGGSDKPERLAQGKISDQRNLNSVSFHVVSFSFRHQDTVIQTNTNRV